MSEPVLAWQQRVEQERLEYSVYRAKYPIRIGVDGTVAFQPGMAVPISSVKKHGWDADGFVERVDGQSLDAPLPDGYVLVEQPADGAGWNDSPDGAPTQGAAVASAPEGQTIEVEGQPAAKSPAS